MREVQADGGTLYNAYGVNNNGQILGFGSVDGFGPAIWEDPAGDDPPAFRKLLPPATYLGAVANAINDHGMAVGNGYRIGVSTVGVTWGANSTNGAVFGGLDVIRDINLADQILGTADTDAGNRAVLWSIWTGTGWLGRRVFDPPLGYHESAGYGLNYPGHVVGSVRRFPEREQPAVWYAVDDLVVLPTLYGGYGRAYDINDDAVVVGESGNDLGDRRATVWIDGEAYELDPEGMRSSANAINADNWVVGFRYGSDGERHATLWILGGGSDRTVEELITDLGTNVADLVADGTLNRGQGNALTSKLDNAQKKVDQGKPKTAANILGALVNQVEAFLQAGTLTPEQAQPLLDDAQAAIDQLLAAGDG
jgi:hypothetical protein